MVGVPGRSKACITCRKRRKGCDFGRPTCTQCRQQGIDCGGYDNQRIFVVSTPEARQPGYSASQIVTAAGGISWEKRDALIYRSEISTNKTNNRLLTRPEDERRCIEVFWEAYFPSGRPIPEELVRSYTCTWAESARNIWGNDDSLRYALWANCLVMTGRRRKAEWIVRDGALMYGKALRGLRQTLGLSRGVRKDETIAVVKLLGMFEALSQQSGNTPPNWRRHHGGELALFIARTPAAHIDGDAHHIYADERAEMALAAIAERKRIVFSSHEWKTVPWTETPKNLKDILLDVLVDVPSLVEEFDAMRFCSDLTKQEILRSKLVESCWYFDGKLMHWIDLVSQIPKPTPETSGNAGPTSLSDQDHVTHIAQVHGMCFFWTTSLVLYTVMRMSCEPETLRHLPGRTDPLHHARFLADALGILLESRAGLYGQQSAALPLEIALEYTGMAVNAGVSSNENGEGLLGIFRRLKDVLPEGFKAAIDNEGPGLCSGASPEGKRRVDKGKQ